MKKFIIGFFVFILLLLVAAVAFPFLFKDKIIQAAKEAANKEMNASLNFSELDVSLLQNFKNFPDVTLVVSNPNIVGKNQFLGDTLVSMDKLHLALDIKSVFQTGNPIKINAIDIKANPPSIPPVLPVLLFFRYGSRLHMITTDVILL